MTAASRKIPLVLLALGAALAALVAALLLGSGPQAAKASSHREAPLISEDPSADNTDLYAFRSPDDPAGGPKTVTIIANYIPLEEPAGGPNFASFSDDVLYELHVDNTGDGREDLTYQFRFHTTTRNGGTFLYNTGPITSLDSANWNRPQTYSVTLVRSDGTSTVLGDNLPVPPVNIGPRSTPNDSGQYDAITAAAVKTLSDGSQVFAGQRDDPFFVDLGSIFDLGGLRPFNTFHAFPLPTSPGVDDVAGYNAHTIALKVPVSVIGHAPNRVLGIYASSSRPSVRILKKEGDSKSVGQWTQVSRLGEPLVNEVLIGLGQKDFWNRSDPEDDQQFLSRYTDPELAGLINGLYPALPDAPTSGRNDLVAVLLTGIGAVPGVTDNFNSTGPLKADLLRLNIDINPSAAAGHGNRLGTLAGDIAGFPNGRRLEDDVVDIELRAVACGYGDVLHSLLGLCNLSPNNLIGDGVDSNDEPILAHFPYVPAPHRGYESHGGS